MTCAVCKDNPQTCVTRFCEHKVYPQSYREWRPEGLEDRLYIDGKPTEQVKPYAQQNYIAHN